MGFYLRSVNLDLGEDNDLNVVLNSKDADRIGLHEGETAMIGIGEIELYCDVIETDSKVDEGEIGLFEEIWKDYDIRPDTSVFIDLPESSASLDAISRKLRGETLTKDDLMLIMKDIGKRKLKETEIAFFISTFFNPGFNDDEIFWMTQGMAEGGDKLDFRGIRDNGNLVADKHSIGGVAGKGITPTLIPILAAGGLVVPNTSTRAITSPAGTADILEVVMPVALSKERIMSTVKETGASMFWGGSLDLSPADDVIINVERSLRIQEFQKVLVSIVAKKVCMNITNILIDLPYGKGTKLEDPEDAKMLDREFRKLFSKFGIGCDVITRFVKGPDGRCVGPNLEIQECLKILERDDDRCESLEKITVEMASKLFENTGKVGKGVGKKYAQGILDSGRALDKFWDIAMAQGATKRIQAKDIKPAKLSFDVLSDRTGTINYISNRALVTIARALGNPKIKDAGMRLYKLPGENVKKGEKLMTIYADTQNRLENGKSLALDLDNIYKFKKS